MRYTGLAGLRVLIATLAGALFFNVIVGVFGIGFAIAGLAVFLVGTVVICSTFPGEGAQP